ncbi:MAG: alpha/beta hydrolase [Verrucomicrobiota bacterium]
MSGVPDLPPGSPPGRGGRMAALLLALLAAGCQPSRHLARRLTQAPNTFPEIYAPPARVYYDYRAPLLAQFPARRLPVGPPAAELQYRVIDPADYHFHSWRTHSLDRGVARPLFQFSGRAPGDPLPATVPPRGTLFLLHGYGVSHDTLLPWGLLLAGEGWRCVLVDLRGHGRSTGRQVGFGTFEIRDLQQLAGHLAREGRLAEPRAVLGVSYGAALALRWQAEDPSLHHCIAISPYASLAQAILCIREEYAPWLPAWIIRPAARRLPEVLQAPPDSLDPLSWMTRLRPPVLLVASDADRITPWLQVDALHRASPAGSRLLVVSGSSHEELCFRFEELGPAVKAWLATPPRRPTAP